ncbi:hypothetical protein WISP_38549 [Willisornis vidua]|uniref:Uncharacterized protein n=1 Tax=Willisornis vidua TaxID=1566151 RepID=A0ABQ9DNG0_9PASS|nr:hypothetical protein WISP_38549 [Willisornis vidua]
MPHAQNAVDLLKVGDEFITKGTLGSVIPQHPPAKGTSEGCSHDSSASPHSSPGLSGCLEAKPPDRQAFAKWSYHCAPEFPTIGSGNLSYNKICISSRRHTKAHTTGVVLHSTIPLSPASPPNKLFYFKPPPQYGGPKQRQTHQAEDILS